MSKIHSDTNDTDLIVSLRQGDRAALSILYDRYGGLVYTLAFKLLDRVDEAEDLTQDVFLSFWKHEKFDPSRAKLSSYLCLLTRSRAIDKLRSRTSEQKSIAKLQHISTPAAEQPTPLDSVTSAQECQLVRQSLASLSQQQRCDYPLSLSVTFPK